MQGEGEKNQGLPPDPQGTSEVQGSPPYHKTTVPLTRPASVPTLGQRLRPHQEEA